MVRFADNIDKIKMENMEPFGLSNYKEIKPILKTSDCKVQDFWEEVFDEDNSSEDFSFTDEDVISEIFERNETDFIFDFDVNDDPVQDLLEKFDAENWNELDESQKLEVVEEFVDCLCEKLDIKERPSLVLFEDDENYCGAFSHDTNTLELNRNILNNPQEIINTVAHEVRHGYQYQRACIGETRMDVLYAINFLEYIAPYQIDGKYVNFNEYENQLIEAEARAFAKLFSN